jgi:hypothetical protein
VYFQGGEVMPQTLDGKCVLNTSDSYLWDVGQYRHALSNWNFTDDTGAQGTYTIFNVTGDVSMFQIWGLCKTTITSAGAPTIELGITGNTAALIAQTAALDLDQYELWQDATPEANPSIAILLARSFVVHNGSNVIMTIGTADITAGDIDFHCIWLPLSANSKVVGT